MTATGDMDKHNKIMNDNTKLGREGTFGLFITLVPKVYNYVFLFVGFYWIFIGCLIKLSVSSFGTADKIDVHLQWWHTKLPLLYIKISDWKIWTLK